MIVHDVEQGSTEWLRLRMGIPTTSDFSNIITPEGKLSGDGARTFAKLKTSEIMAGAPIEKGKSHWMERGNELEPEAVETYEFITGNRADVVGFITTDDSKFGASPDRLVNDDGLLEIKCPSPWQHTEYLIENKVSRIYRPQLQGQLLITEREWVDWYSYHPLLPPLIIRVFRDDQYIERIKKAMARFSDLMEINKQKLISNGYWQEGVTA